MEVERRTLLSSHRQRRLPGRGEEDENDELVKEPAVGAAFVLLVVVFALDIYRAVTQSITCDEALTFHYYVLRSIDHIFTDFIANDHVLHSLMAWASVRLFGISEWALRLPALLGGLIYLVSSLRVCRRAFGGGWVFLLGFTLLALNPLLLDFQSIARGYGLALGLTMYAMVHLLSALHGHETSASGTSSHSHLFRASIGLGLSVAANLTLAPLAGALMLMSAIAILAQRRTLPGGARTSGSVWAALSLLVMPFALVAGALLWVPLHGHRPGGFFVGLDTLSGSAVNLLDHALAHGTDAWPLAPSSPFYAAARGVLLVLAGPVLLLLVIVRLVRVIRAWRGKTSVAELVAADRFHFLAGGALLVALGVLFVAHHALGLAYPIDRTGLWVVAMVQLAAVGLVADGLRGGPVAKTLAALAAVALWGLVVQYGSQIQAREYPIWRYDAGTRAVFDEIKRQNDREPRETVVVEAFWAYEPALNFYRLARRAQWMPPIERSSPLGYDPEHLRGDWLVFLPSEEARPIDELVEVRYQDPVSGTVLGIPRHRDETPAR